MRQLMAVVPLGKGQEALKIAKAHDAMNLVCVQAQDASDSARETVFGVLPNSKIDSLVHELQRNIHDLRITLIPLGVIALRPPENEAPAQVKDVTSKGPLEVFLEGLQSIGSWKGFLGYAAASGVVVWIGLHTNTVYLLTAAMLIAPFAGPAMTLALGTARGDLVLIRQSLLRYVASLTLSVVVGWILSTLMGQEIATQQMLENSFLSSTAVLLPLTAGAAGALNLCQSERNSLVTAAGPGMLVAASLAPPAGMIGMAAAISEWDMVKSGLFVLLLQLVVINLSGSVVFALFGLSPKGVRYDRGRSWLKWASAIVTLVGLGLLLFWQFSSKPQFQRSTRAQRISHEIKSAVQSSGLAKLVEVDARFTRADIPGQNTLLAVIYVQKNRGIPESDIEIKRRIEVKLRDVIIRKDYNVTPLVEVRVLQAP